MLKNLWNYFKGYVIIEITGFSIERFFNLTVHKGIVVSDLMETKNGVSCKINIKDFKSLKEISKKTGCKSKIKIKYGLPFFIFKNKKRKFFLIGLFSFVFILYFLSSFVWSIEIIGNNFLDNNKILAFCEENNLYLGSYKKTLALKELQTELKNNFDELSWVSISLTGTKVTIKVSENIPKEENEVNNEPCHIVATQDGIITEIVTRSGTPLVSQKDTFQKGDILVSGELVLKEGEEIKGSYFTTADADIRAKVIKEINVEVPFNYQVKEYTENVKKEYNLLAFNKVFSLNLLNLNINYENYDKITSRNQLKLSEDFLLPFIFIKTEYREYNKVDKTFSLDEAMEYADKLIYQKITSEIDFSSDILSTEISYEEFENKIIAKATITLIENIGEKVPISYFESIEEENENTENIEENTENGTNQIAN